MVKIHIPCSTLRAFSVLHSTFDGFGTQFNLTHIYNNNSAIPVPHFSSMPFFWTRKWYRIYFEKSHSVNNKKNEKLNLYQNRNYLKFYVIILTKLLLRNKKKNYSAFPSLQCFCIQNPPPVFESIPPFDSMFFESFPKRLSFLNVWHLAYVCGTNGQK